MPFAMTKQSRNVPIRRRIEVKVQTFARTLVKVAFYLRNGYHFHPIEAWKKAWVTL